MFSFLDNLSQTDYIIIFFLTMVILIAGFVLIIYLNKKNKPKNLLEYSLKDEEEKKPEIGMQLATDKIPEIEKEKKIEAIDCCKESENNKDTIINDKKPVVEMQLATEIGKTTVRERA